MINFRCHENSTFEIPDAGMTLLSGGNGAGKSTVLLAIIYALYGQYPQKVKKYTHGKTTCTVILEYAGMKITRAKPQQVQVEIINDSDDTETYEGDAAQSIIERILNMNYQQFVAGAFISHRKSTSVLTMTATEQLNFVSSLTSAQSNVITEIRDKIKQDRKRLHAEKLRAEGELDTLENQKIETETDLVVVPTPDIVRNGTNIDDLRTQIKTLTIENRKLEKQRDEITTTITQRAKLEKNRKTTLDKIATLDVEIKHLEKLLTGIDIPDNDKIKKLEDEANQLRKTITHYENYIAYLNESSVLTTTIAAFEATTTARINELEALVVDETELESMRVEAEAAELENNEYTLELAGNETIIKNKEIAKDAIMNTFHKIKNQYDGAKNIKSPKVMIDFIGSLVASIEQKYDAAILKSSPKYTCPQCETRVTVHDDRLVECDDLEEDIVDDAIIKNLKTSINVLRKYSTIIADAAIDFNAKPKELGDKPVDYKILYQRYLAASNLIDEYATLVKKSLPDSLLKMKNKLAETKKTFKETLSLETCKNYVVKLKGDLESSIRITEELITKYNEYTTNKSLLASKKKSMATLEKSLPDEETPSVILLNKQRDTIVNTIVANTKTISDVHAVIDTLREYEDYQKSLSALETLANKIDAVKESQIVLEHELEGNKGLEEATKEAEIILLEEIVNSINEHAKIYLDRIFPQNVSVRLVCIKDHRTQGYKLQFNTVIIYDGYELDSIEELSDGEFQWCDNAFLLAVNDVIGSNILIMDESENCMDVNSNMEVLSMIHDLCGHKMILMVSQSAVRGIFDDEIKISKNNNV